MLKFPKGTLLLTAAQLDSYSAAYLADAFLITPQPPFLPLEERDAASDFLNYQKRSKGFVPDLVLIITYQALLDGR